MQRIYKYELALLTEQILELPIDAQIIRVEDVEGKGYLWAMVNPSPSYEKEHRYIELYKTGQDIPTDAEDLAYLGAIKFTVGQEICLYAFENLYKRGDIPE